MRARSLALIGALLVCSLGMLVPGVVHASLVFRIGSNIFTQARVISFPHYTYGGYVGTTTALRVGAVAMLRVGVTNTFGYTPSVAADLSLLNGKNITTSTPATSHADPALGGTNYTYQLGPFAVGTGVTNGLYKIPLTADAFESIEGTSSVSVLVDTIPPTVRLSEARASTTASTLTLFLSGSADGTGSEVKAIALEGDAYNSAGALLASGPVTHSFVDTALGSLNAAIASSTDGSFAEVSISIDASQFPLAQAASLKLTLAVADQAGNIATTSATVSLAPPIPKLSSVLFIPGTEASRLYRRDILGVEHQVWEPDLFTDIPFLAMNPDGTSKYQLYTKDIINSIAANNAPESVLESSFGQNLQVYGAYETFMNKLVASSTVDMTQWRAYPYDWRYDPIDIVNDGTLTEMPNGSIQRVYLEKLLEQMASSSATGQVTIIAHSNGGLLAKALLNKLQQEGKTNLIDQLIMVGTPQWGTPSDIGVMLHGDGQLAGFGLVMTPSAARKASQYMPDGYALFPSAAYFSHVATPVGTFDRSGSLSDLYANAYGASTTSFTALSNFLEDTAGLDATMPEPNSLHTPLVLSKALMEKADTLHALLDNWTPPTGIKVTTIAGWGQLTLSGLKYTTETKTQCSSNTQLAIAGPGVCAQVSYLEHQPILTQDGDNTVVSPSALGSVGQRLYFDTHRYGKGTGVQIVHQDLTAADPIQSTLVALLENKKNSQSAYVSADLPSGGSNPLVQISSHSPVHLVVANSSRAQTGVVPIPGTDFAGIKRDILGSAVQVLDDEEYVTLPQSGQYHVSASGYATGTATINIAIVRGDGIASTTAALVDVPVAASTSISFTVTDGAPGEASIDENGDGTPDLIVSTSTFSGDPISYVRYMESVVNTMSLPHPFAKEVSARLRAIETTVSMHARVWRTLAHFPKLLSRHHLVENLQITVLERSIEARAASKKGEWEENDGRGRRVRGPEMENVPNLSIIDAQTLISMLSYLKTLL